MEKIIFGDNQFFGVNHMSEEKARQQLMRFKDMNTIIKVLDSAYELGINAFMCTTHDKISELCDHMRNNKEKYTDFIFYPCMPYAHKYADAVTELGMLKALQSFIKGTSIVNLLARGGKAIAKFDAIEIMKILVDTEMKMFKGLSTPIIFLQNVVVDLLLGLEYKQIFKEFEVYVNKKYNAEAGFITMNLPKLLPVLEGVGVSNPIICSNINKIGFRMCGGIEQYEKLISTNSFRPIAMSIFASGAISPQEAIEYVGGLKGLHSVVFGASSKNNIAQSKQLLDRYLSS